MAFTPVIEVSQLRSRIEELEALRLDVEGLDVPPPLGRWLTHYMQARGAHMSTRIEGNPLTERDVLDLFQEAEGSGSAAGRDERENLDYRDAARLATQVAEDPHADLDGGLVRGLHYLTVRTTDPYGTAGQFRLAQNVVRAGRTVVYLPPPYGEVPSRMDDLVAWLRSSRGELHPLVLAAVAHAEFVKIHPFDDGNGRAARALTVYFMARGGWRLRGYVGVEQVFGEDIEGYRAQLNALGDRYPLSPPDLTHWVAWVLGRLAFELRVDLAVARAYVHAVGEVLPRELEEQGLPARLAHAYGVLWLEGSLTSALYARAARVTGATAAADLRRLVDRGVLTRAGAGRSTRYESVDTTAVLDREAIRREVAGHT